MFASGRASETRTRVMSASQMRPVANYRIALYLVDPKGIEPSTLSLQGRNASHWNMRAQINIESVLLRQMLFPVYYAFTGDTVLFHP